MPGSGMPMAELSALCLGTLRLDGEESGPEPEGTLLLLVEAVVEVASVSRSAVGS